MAKWILVKKHEIVDDEKAKVWRNGTVNVLKDIGIIPIDVSIRTIPDGTTFSCICCKTSLIRMFEFMKSFKLKVQHIKKGFIFLCNK